jgi:hypothetical protein
MHDPTREEMLRQIEADEEAFRAEWEASVRKFAATLEQDRAMFAEAERTSGGGLNEQMVRTRARVDEAERDFYERADQAMRNFNAAAERARRAIG